MTFRLPLTVAEHEVQRPYIRRTNVLLTGIETKYQ